MASPRYIAKGVALFIAGTLAACATVIPYEPNVALSREDARAALKQAFEEQPPKFRPIAIEIGDDAIRLGFSKVVGSQWGIASIATRETYYYSNLEQPQLFQKGGRYQIELSNREHSVRRWVLFYSQDKAFSFLDAVQRMRRAEKL